MDSTREAVGWLDRHATYTRTGHHSARTGGGGTAEVAIGDPSPLTLACT